MIGFCMRWWQTKIQGKRTEIRERDGDLLEGYLEAAAAISAFLL